MPADQGKNNRCNHDPLIIECCKMMNRCDQERVAVKVHGCKNKGQVSCQLSESEQKEKR